MVGDTESLLRVLFLSGMSDERTLETSASPGVERGFSWVPDGVERGFRVSLQLDDAVLAARYLGSVYGGVLGCDLSDVPGYLSSSDRAEAYLASYRLELGL